MQSSPTQLSLDFSAIQHSQRRRIPNLAQLKTRSSIQLYANGSSLDEHSFSFKCQYKRRSFRVSGTYGTSRSSDYGDGSGTDILLQSYHIRKIEVYEDGKYHVFPLSERERTMFERFVGTVLHSAVQGMTA